MKTILLIILGSVGLTSSSFASWEWSDTGAAISLGDGNSGAFSRTPIGADYDILNENDGEGFDQAPTAISFSWDSGSEPIGIMISADGSFFDFDLDFDNDDVLPTSIAFDVIYSQAISERGINGGGLFANVNPLATTLDFQLTVLDASLNQIGLSATNNFRTIQGATNPTTFSGGSAVFDDFSNAGGFAGLTNGGYNASTAFPRSNPTSDPALAAGGLNLLFSDFADAEEFRISFDGGVTTDALTVIPEPSVSLLGSLACLALLRRRSKG